MKVYAAPDELPFEHDYKDFDLQREAAREEEHRAKLKAWLIKQGYTGKHTGKTVRFGVADGYAEYMIADGRRSALIHLPYGDAWDYRDVEFIPKKEIIRRAEQQDRAHLPAMQLNGDE